MRLHALNVTHASASSSRWVTLSWESRFCISLRACFPCCKPFIAAESESGELSPGKPPSCWNLRSLFMWITDPLDCHIFKYQYWVAFTACFSFGDQSYFVENILELCFSAKSMHSVCILSRVSYCCCIPGINGKLVLAWLWSLSNFSCKLWYSICLWSASRYRSTILGSYNFSRRDWNGAMFDVSSWNSWIPWKST